MADLLKLTEDPRVTVRRAGAPDAEGTCVVYWMQRAQRGVDTFLIGILGRQCDAAEALLTARRPGDER